MKKEFNKIEYFKMIKNIMTEVKKKELPYNRIYSEPREYGYRTKLWLCSKPTEVTRICEKLYPGKFVVTYSPGIQYMAGYQKPMLSLWSVSIKPKTK